MDFFQVYLKFNEYKLFLVELIIKAALFGI